MPNKWVFITIALFGVFVLYQIDKAKKQTDAGSNGGGGGWDGLGTPTV